MNFGSTDKSFTQNWLQSLTQVANEPTAKRIKPLLDTINDLSRMNTESNRLESAQKLWDFTTSEDLKSLLESSQSSNLTGYSIVMIRSRINTSPLNQPQISILGLRASESSHARLLLWPKSPMRIG